MSPTGYYLTHVLAMVVALAAISFLIGLGFGWLAWGSYPQDAVYFEKETERLRRELNS